MTDWNQRGIGMKIEQVANIHIGQDGAIYGTELFRLDKDGTCEVYDLSALHGEGVVDFKRVFTLLKERGYDRFITIEREIEGEEQKRDIERGFIYLKEILKNI